MYLPGEEQIELWVLFPRNSSLKPNALHLLRKCSRSVIGHSLASCSHWQTCFRLLTGFAACRHIDSHQNIDVSGTWARICSRVLMRRHSVCLQGGTDISSRKSALQQQQLHVTWSRVFAAWLQQPVVWFLGVWEYPPYNEHTTLCYCAALARYAKTKPQKKNIKKVVQLQMSFFSCAIDSLWNWP